MDNYAGASETEFGIFEDGHYEGGGTGTKIFLGFLIVSVLLYIVISIGLMDSWFFSLTPTVSSTFGVEESWALFGPDAANANTGNAGNAGNAGERLSAVWARNRGNERLVAGGSKHKSMYHGTLERTCGRSSY